MIIAAFVEGIKKKERKRKKKTNRLLHGAGFHEERH